MNLSQIKQLIENNNVKTFDELFKLVNNNIEYAMVGCCLLDLPHDFVSSLYNQIPKTEDEILDLIEKYEQDQKVLYFLLPKTVQSALILFTYPYNSSFTLMSSMMVNNLKDLPHYLSDVKKHNVFDSDIFFFSSMIDLKQDNIISLIENDIKSMNIVFSEPFYKQLLLHFELSKYLGLSSDSVKDLSLVIKEYYQDIVKEHCLKFQATIREDKIEVFICTIDLIQFFFQLKSFNVEKVFDNFLKEIKAEFQDELLESSFKIALMQQLGVGVIDVGVKALKVFLKTFQSSSGIHDSLDQNNIETNYVEFKNSKKNDVKEWFLDKIEKEFNHVNRDFFKEHLKLGDDFFEKQYSLFINKYLYLYLQNHGSPKEIDNHTQVFTDVYDQVILLKGNHLKYML